jgi:23S rRNA (adenine2030-N6)-methyltransferase
MNYRHVFHAGNFADVFKHVLLTRLLVYLTRKETPLRYIDTHAGVGVYDLSSPYAQKTGEWREGIGRLLDASLAPAAAELLLPYLDIVREIFPTGGSAAYPGSPRLAARLLRRNDRLMLCELHPQDARKLEAAMGRDRRVTIETRDGYEALNAFVPPPERRGLVLIDPPFERRDEFNCMFNALVSAHRKWSTGVFALWYPLKDPSAAEWLGNSVVAAGIRRVLKLELDVRPFDPEGPMSGCGLLVVNPTHGFRDEASLLLPELSRILAIGHGAWRIAELAGE